MEPIPGLLESLKIPSQLHGPRVLLFEAKVPLVTCNWRRKEKRSGERENEREGLKEKTRSQAAKVTDEIHFLIEWKSFENSLGYKEARQSPGLFFLFV
jgi:hypothetical protein